MKDREFAFMTVETSIMVNGKRVKRRALGNIRTTMVLKDIADKSEMTEPKDKENVFMSMENIMDSIKIMKKKDKEYLRGIMVIIIQVGGKMELNKDGEN